MATQKILRKEIYPPKASDFSFRDKKTEAEFIEVTLNNQKNL